MFSARLPAPWAPRGPAALALAIVAGCGGGEERRPSAILISLDTLRADHMSLYGYTRDTTPYLDRLAEESVVFERAFAPAAWTLVSHMTMLTGLYPNQHGVVDWKWALADETPLLAERLRRLGYQTVGLYYQGWIHRRHGFDRGFDVFRAHESAEEAGEHLTEALSGLDPERPFFLFLHLFDIHCGPLGKEPGPIYDCPPPYDELFLPGAAERLPKLSEHRLWNEPGLLGPDALEGLAALYDGGIRHVDDKLALWIEDWKRAGWLDDTLLVVTADHGESLGQRGLGIKDHGGPYQEGLRVPLIVRRPDGVGAGERVYSTVHLADVVPTILAWVGVGADAALPGRSLFDPIPADRVVYALSPPSFEIVIQWPEKLVRAPKRNLLIRVDLQADPAELTAEPLDPAEFERRRRAFLDETGDGELFPAPTRVEWESMEEVERLQQLGYGGGPARE